MAMRTPLKLLLLVLLALAAGQLRATANEAAVEPEKSATALADLRIWLAVPRADRKPLAEQPFASVALSKADAATAEELLWTDHVELIKSTRSEEMQARKLTDGDSEMKFGTVVFPPKEGAGAERPALFISMHGGGGAPPQVNDSQWQNQIRLGQGYQPVNAIYVAPRAPTDTWDLWHTSQVDRLFGRLIENMIVLENVDPDRVYLMGYSAGGDGAYQLAPRMADQLAAASAMAGHPNNASPRGLRNLPFTIHVGALDTAYGRNEVATQWEEQLKALQAEDADGYKHFVHVHAGKGHWMNMEDKEAIPWMQQYRRNPLPDRIVWRQGNVPHNRFYWLACDEGKANGDEIIAKRDGQKIDVTVTAGTPPWKVRLNDAMLNLDEPVTITVDGKTVFEGKLPRTIETLSRTVGERGDPQGVFSAEFSAPAS